ncbi:hypothetical protein [Streptomyces sp. Ac-502]|uniref:hypothetical protein n=1 Tax=Streptomyces sp. Ac-502 TaxID=3342801 RepID=UPI00386295D0
MSKPPEAEQPVTRVTALDVSAYRAALTSYRNIVVAHIAWTLVYAETDEEHVGACQLAASLDKAGLNVDTEIEQRVDEIGCAVTTAWKRPSIRRAERDSEPAPF